MAAPPANSGTDRPDRPDGSTLHIVGGSVRLIRPREALARDVELEYAELELVDVASSLDLDGGPEQFRDRATRLHRIAVTIGWPAIERALTSLGPVRLRPQGEGVGFEIAYGRSRTPVAASLSLGPSHGSELEVAFDPAWVFGPPGGPTVRLSERVRQALVRATGAAAPAVARGFRAAGPTSFVFDWARAALWPALPRRGLKMPEVPSDLSFWLEADDHGLRLSGERGAPRRVPTGFAEARSRQAELHHGHDAELLLARGRWAEAFEIYASVLQREGGPPALLDRTVELGVGVQDLRARTLELIEAELAKRPDWTYGRLGRGVIRRAGGDEAGAREDLEAVAAALRDVDGPTAGWAHAAAVLHADGEARVAGLEAAAALRPDDPAILRELVELLPTVGRARAGVRVARRWAEVAPTEAERGAAMAAEARILRDPVGDLPAAQQLIDAARRLAPEDAAIRAEAAQVALSRRNFDDAAAGFQALAEQADRAHDAAAAGHWWSQVGRARSEEGAWDAALAALDRAHARDPRDLRLWARLLATARQAGQLDWGRARFDANQLSERGPAAAAVLREAALLWRDHEPQRSAELLRAAHAADPDDLEALEAQLHLPPEAGVEVARVASDLAVARASAGDREGSLRAAHRALDALAPPGTAPATPSTASEVLDTLEVALTGLEDRSPVDVDVARVKLRWAQATGRTRAIRLAARDLIERLEPGPERSRLLLDWGRALPPSGDRDEAARRAQRVTEVESLDDAARHRALELRLRAVDAAGDGPELIPRLEALLAEVDPGSADAGLLRERLRGALRADGRFEALHALERAAARRPGLTPSDRARAWLAAAEVAQRNLRDPSAARADLDGVFEAGAAAIDRGVARAASRLSLEVANALNDPEEGLRARARVLELEAPEAREQVRLEQAEALLDVGRADEAIALLEDAARGDLTRVAPAARLAELARDRGDLDAAAGWFDQAAQRAERQGQPAAAAGFHAEAARMLTEAGEDEGAARHDQALLALSAAPTDLRRGALDRLIERARERDAHAQVADLLGQAAELALDPSPWLLERGLVQAYALGDAAAARATWMRAPRGGAAAPAVAAELERLGEPDAAAARRPTSGPDPDPASPTIPRPAAARPAASDPPASPEDAAAWAARWEQQLAAVGSGQTPDLEAIAAAVEARRRLSPSAAAAALADRGLDAAEADWDAVLDQALQASAAAADWAQHARWLDDRAEAANEPRVAAALHHRRATLLHEALNRPDEALEAFRAARAAAGDDGTTADIEEDYERFLAESGRLAQLVEELGPAALEARWSAWRATGDPRARAAAQALWARYPVGSERRAELLWDLAEDPGQDGLRALHQLVVDGPDAARRRASLQLEARYEASGEPERVLAVLRERAASEVDDAFRARTCARIASVLQWGLRDVARAEDEYRAALALDPACEPARQGLALLWEEQERYEAILADLGVEALREVRDGALHRQEAPRAISATDVLVAATPEAAAREWMRVAEGLHTKPSSQAVAWARAARAGSEAAVDALRAALDRAPPDDPDRRRLAELLSGLVSDAERARYLLEQARAAPPDEAVELLRTAAALRPEDPEITRTWASALAQAGRWDELADALGPGALEPWAEQARADADPIRKERFLLRSAEGSADPERTAARWFELGRALVARGEVDEAWSAFARGATAGPTPVPEGLMLLRTLGGWATRGTAPSAFALAGGGEWTAERTAVWLDGLGPDRATATGTREGQLLLRAALATSPAVQVAELARDEREGAALEAQLRRGLLDPDWSPTERVRAALTWLQRSPGDPAAEAQLDAVVGLTSEAPETLPEVRAAWLENRVRGDAEQRLTAIRRLIAATDGLRDFELLALEVQAALEVGDWDGAEYAVDALLDSDATPVEARRSAARAVVATAGAAPRLLERAWVELARPETSPEPRAQLEALLALADGAEARGAPVAEVAGPLEISLGLPLEEPEAVRIRRRLVRQFESVQDWARAERHQTAVAEMTREAEAFQALAELRARRDDVDGAAEAAARALAVDPGLGAAHALRVQLAAAAGPEAELRARIERARQARAEAPEDQARWWLDALRGAASAETTAPVAVSDAQNPSAPSAPHLDAAPQPTVDDLVREAVAALPRTEAFDTFARELAADPPAGFDAARRAEVVRRLLDRWGPEAPLEPRLRLAEHLRRQDAPEAALDVLEPALHARRVPEDPVVEAWWGALNAVSEPQRALRVTRALEQLGDGPLRSWIAAELGETPPPAGRALSGAEQDRLAVAEAAARRGALDQALALAAELPEDVAPVLARRVEWSHRLGRVEAADALVAGAEARRVPLEAAHAAWLAGLRGRWNRSHDAGALVGAVEERFEALGDGHRLEALGLLLEAGALETVVRSVDGLAPGRAHPEVTATAVSAELRRGWLDAASARAEAAGLTPELARLRMLAEDHRGVLAALEALPPAAALAHRIDRAWAAVFVRMERLGEPCADHLHAVRADVDLAAEDELAPLVSLLRDLAARAERLARPDDARALRERLAPFDPDGRAALVDGWLAAGRYDAVVRYFDAHAPETPEDHEALISALAARGRAEEALTWAQRLLDPEATSERSPLVRARRLGLGARVALEAGAVALGLDWGRLAAWLDPHAFDPSGFEAAIDAGPPTPEKLERLLDEVRAGAVGPARLDELRRVLEAAPNPRATALLEAERARRGPDLDLDAVVEALDGAGAKDDVDRWLKRVFEDPQRDPTTRTRALHLRLGRASSEHQLQDILRSAQTALQDGLDGALTVALEAARRSGHPEVELDLLRAHGSGLEAATRIAEACRDEAPLEAARALDRAFDDAPAERQRTLIAHATPLLRALGRPDAEADLWARLALRREGTARAAALSRLAVVRAKELDDRRGALAAWRAAVQTAPEDLDSRRGAASAAVALGELREARAHVEEAARWAVRLDQTDAALAFLLQGAELAARTNDDAAEAAIWRSLLRLRPETSVVLESLVARGRRAGGARHLEILQARIDEMDPGFARGRLRVAAARLLERPLERLDEAEQLRAAAAREDLPGEDRETSTDLLAEPPPPEWATADLGVSRSELRLAGRFDHWAALEAARAEGSAEPALQARLWVEVARIHQERRAPEPKPIREALTRAVAHHPLYAPALEALLRFEVSSGRWVEARRTLERLERIGGPGWPAGDLELLGGRIFTEVGEPEEAARRYRRALERDPDGLAARRALAELTREPAALQALASRLDPQLDRAELARVELSSARQALAAGDADAAAGSVERALRAAPDLDDGSTLRRRIAEASARDEATVREAILLEAGQLDRPELWQEAISKFEAVGDEARLARLLDVIARRDPPPSLRPRLVAHLRARGEHEGALELLEREGGFTTAPEPSAAELSAWARAFDQRERWADVFRVLAHARHHGLLEAVLTGLGPPTEEAPSGPEVNLWLADRVGRLDAAALADPRVQAGLSILAERHPTPGLDRARAEAGREDPQRRYRALERQLEANPFDLTTLEAYAEVTTGSRRAGAQAVRRFLATGDGRLEDPEPVSLDRLMEAGLPKAAREGAEDLGLDAVERVVEGTPGPGRGVAVRPALHRGFGVEMDPRRGEVRLGRGWYDHAPEPERRYVATRAVLSHLAFEADAGAVDAWALWVTRDLGAAVNALRRETWRGLVEPADDPRARTEMLQRDRRAFALLDRCARGELLGG